MANEYLSIPEAARILGLSRIAVFKQVKKGRLPAIRIGRNWAVPAAALADKGLAGGGARGESSTAQGAVAPNSVGDRGFEDLGWD